MLLRYGAFGLCLARRLSVHPGVCRRSVVTANCLVWLGWNFFSEQKRLAKQAQKEKERLEKEVKRSAASGQVKSKSEKV